MQTNSNEKTKTKLEPCHVHIKPNTLQSMEMKTVWKVTQASKADNTCHHP